MLRPAIDSGPDPETLLFLKAQRGDAQAFRQLVGLLAAPSLALAMRTLGNLALAEEAVQEALTKVWREAGRFEEGRSFWPWWRRILLNAALDGRRRMRSVEPLETAGDPVDPGPSPFEVAAEDERAARLAAAMAALPPRQRAALALFHGEGLSMAEIGEALGTSAKAVEGLLSRGRAALKALLEEDGEAR
ncbi:MAG: sigma-70 family RNA polymerase sigma factor [Sphingomonadaceae bacterium]